MRKICSVSPVIFNDYLVISLTKDWLKYFEKLPTFTAIIDNKSRLVLVGPQISFNKIIKKS